MNDPLERYLNDHLAGATGAIAFIGDLAERQEGEEERSFYLELKEKVSADQGLLKNLIQRAGMEETVMAQVTGGITSRAGKLKLMWEGLEPGKLGQFEALEMLALGIQGKKLLWTVLGEVAPLYPEWEGVDFAALKQEARRQREEVEQRRLNAGREALPDPQRSRPGS